MGKRKKKPGVISYDPEVFRRYITIQLVLLHSYVFYNKGKVLTYFLSYKNIRYPLVTLLAWLFVVFFSNMDLLEII